MAADPPASGRRLVLLRLVLVLTGVGVVLSVLLFGVFGPLSTRAFRTASDELIGAGVAAMRTQARDDNDASAALLVELIRQTTDARRRTLEDLPLALYGGDVERIRARVLEDDAARADRLERNVVVLAGEMERRGAERIERSLTSLRARQAALADAFGARVRTLLAWIAGAVLGITLLALGFGLYRQVVLAEVQRLNLALEREVAAKTGQLVQAAKMASIGTLAGGVAHEFNNVIGGVRGCLREALEDEREPDRREPLEIALRATDRAEGIVRQLLDFARPPVGRRERVDLTALAGEVCELVRPAARGGGVEIVQELRGPAPVHGDAGALHQVVLNLATNALQAMPDGGTLTVRVATGADAVVLEVRDEGVGIEAEHLERVFDPFYTSKDREADASRRGSGLGLPVSYGIVQAHGGTIRIESEVGVGTAFFVTFPALRSPHAAAAVAAPSPGPQDEREDEDHHG